MYGTGVSCLRATAFLALLTCAMSAPAGAQDRGLGEIVPKPPPERPAGPDPQSLDPIVQNVLSFSLEEQAGQLMLVTLSGQLRPDAADRRVLDMPPGGVVIPRLSRPANAARYVRNIRASRSEAQKQVPLLIGADVYALTEHDLMPDRAYLQIPTLMSVGATANAGMARKVANIVADHLTAMGFNLHLGPSLELASSLSQAVDRLQIIGSDPVFVGEVAEAFHGSFDERGLLWMPTGFPGGGANRRGTEPAALLTPREALTERDLAPYIRAIEAGAPMIHVGNTLVPTIDPAAGVASLSRVVITDVLRGELGFQGIVVAGPMDGPAITAAMQSHDAAIRAIEAGADMLYWSRPGSRVEGAIAAIVAAVERGRMDPRVVESAFARILAMKKEQQLRVAETPDEKDLKKFEKEVKEGEDAYEVERHAVTLLQNLGDTLPLTKEKSWPIGIIGVLGVDALHDPLEEYVKDIARQPIGTARHDGRIHDFEIDRIRKYNVGLRTAICLFSSDLEPAGARDVVRALNEIGTRVVAVVIGHPSLVPHLGEAQAVLAVYSHPEALSESMRALADVLVGNAPIEILKPNRDLERAAGQEIPFNVYDVIRSPVGRLPVAVTDALPSGFSTGYVPEIGLKKALWDFGDGKRSNDFQTTHAYQKPGRYEITLTVTPDLGEEVTGTFHVRID